ncbi:replication protein, partial [Alcanivorax xiamenensis]
LKLYRHGVTMGTPPKKNDHLRAKRGTVEGWSESATRRMVHFLRSVDERTLDTTASGEPLRGYAITLTVRDCPPTADDWKRLRNAYFKRLTRLGVYRVHWVTEWQRRGVPHLHGALWLPISVPRGELLLNWVAVANEFGASLRGQYSLEINDTVGWFKYLSKHSARGVQHYQRHPENIPPSWKKKTGRVWGKTGDWATTDPVEFDISSEAYYRLRRILRNWRIADARTAGNSWRIKSARGMLKSHRRELSDVRGASEWLEMGPALQVLDYLRAQGHEITC